MRPKFHPRRRYALNRNARAQAGFACRHASPRCGCSQPSRRTPVNQSAVRPKARGNNQPPPQMFAEADRVAGSGRQGETVAPVELAVGSQLVPPPGRNDAAPRPDRRAGLRRWRACVLRVEDEVSVTMPAARARKRPKAPGDRLVSAAARLLSHGTKITAHSGAPAAVETLVSPANCGLFDQAPADRRWRRQQPRIRPGLRRWRGGGQQACDRPARDRAARANPRVSMTRLQHVPGIHRRTRAPSRRARFPFPYLPFPTSRGTGIRHCRRWRTGCAFDQS